MLLMRLHKAQGCSLIPNKESLFFIIVSPYLTKLLVLRFSYQSINVKGNSSNTK